MGVSLFVGLVVPFCLRFSEKFLSSKIFTRFLCSAVATLLAFLSVWCGIIRSVDMVIIGNIMTLVPGVGLTNALRDLLVGDSVSGLLRLIEAILMAIAIAAGYFLVAVLGGFVP